MTNIQILPNWGYHIPSQSPISGKDPALLTVYRGSPFGTAMLIGVEGPSWATVEAYILVPVIPSPSVKLSFDLTLDAASIKSLGRVETDIKRFDGKEQVNFSLQRLTSSPPNNQPPNSIQISGQDGGWLDAGIIAPAFTPDKPQHHEIYYAGSPSRSVYGTQAVIIDGQAFMIKPELQNLTPLPSTWTAGELIQIQVTLGELRGDQAWGAGHILIDNVVLEAQ